MILSVHPQYLDMQYPLGFYRTSRPLLVIYGEQVQVQEQCVCCCVRYDKVEPTSRVWFLFCFCGDLLH